MAEKSEVIASLMRTQVFRNRVRSIVANKAASVLAEATPDADELAWAKNAIATNYDAWVESVLILVETQPATVAVAMAAGDAAYTTAFATVFAQTVAAKM